MTTAAISIARYARFFSQQGAETVLDYGTGTLRNALHLLEQGFTVYAADLPEQVRQLRGHPAVPRLAGLLEVGELEQSRLGVDLVLSTYVFNIIRQKVQRRRYLENVVANLKPGGYLLMEVCCWRDEMACGSADNRYLDCDECSSTYTHYQLDYLLAPYGLRRICQYYRNHSVAAVYRRTDR
jgi:SAM-dependent methyltransferase